MHKNIEALFYIFLLAFIVFSISFGIATHKQPQIAAPNQYSFDFTTYTLVIQFNQEEQDGMIATTMLNKTNNSEGVYNYYFNKRFNQDLDRLSAQLGEVYVVSVERWYTFTDATTVNVLFKNNVTEQRKDEVLNDIVADLRGQWYSEKVEIV